MNSSPYTDVASLQYIEPTICFTKNKMKIGENYPMEKLPITKLVKKDQVLVEFSDSDFPDTDNLVRRSMSAGANTYLSEDNNQVLAETTGYPKIAFCPVQESEKKALDVSVEPLFLLSKDGLKASIVIKPLLYNYTTISSEELYQLLTSSGITTGIKYKQLNFIKKCIRTGHTDTDDIVVARGKEPVAGTNAFLKFKIEIGPIPGKLLTDGSIDFRERKIMVPVSRDQVIASKVPATKGTPGVTVLGEPIAQLPGLDIEVKTTDDAIYSPENLQVSATSDGVLSVVRDNVIRVCSKQEIHGDIDYATGNVESRNSLVIHGSVLPGFLVKTGGDLEIKGSIMSTQVSSLSNIIIKGGIIGNSSSITASGDIDLHFIEQGRIRCKGNCIIRKQCYYSHISSGGDIRCKEHSAIVGGELIAEGNISLGDAGAPGADPVFIAAGVVAERLYQSRKLQQRLKEYKESIVQRLKGYTGVARTKKIRSLKHGIEAIRLQHLRVNMIPGTGLYSRSTENPESNLAGTLNNQPKRRGLDIRSISIDVHGTVFAGTSLQIGNRTLTVKDTMTGQRFQLDTAARHIVTMPLR